MCDHAARNFVAPPIRKLKDVAPGKIPTQLVSAELPGKRDVTQLDLLVKSGLPVSCAEEALKETSSTAEEALEWLIQNAEKKPDENSRTENRASRKLHVVRHAERVDFTYGGDWWIENCFDNNGAYHILDANMPRMIPKRPPTEFDRDCPLTRVGLMQAKLSGQMMKESGVILSHVYCSPALRCLSTATEMLKSLGVEDISMRVEPGLFEWMAWFQEVKPVFLTPGQMVDFGFNVDMSYVPIVQTPDLNVSESLAQYYERSHFVIRKVLERTIGDVLMVAHGASLEVLTRNLTGKPTRDLDGFHYVLHRTPYCSAVSCEQSQDGTWKLVAPPCGKCEHHRSYKYDILQVLA